MMDDGIKKLVSSSFKLSGLGLRSDSSRSLINLLKPLDEDVRQGWINKIIENLLKQSLDSNIIEEEQIKQAALECCQEETEDDDENILTIISAFDVPKFTYNQERKKFVSNEALGIPESSLFPPASGKADLFIRRYTILMQRTMRHDLFRPSTIQAADQGKKFNLKNIEFLLSSNVLLGDIIVLGMVTQLKEGKFHLEDPTGVVEMDLSKTKFHEGLFTECCFVIAEGSYDDHIFHVTGMGFPPPEPAKITRSYFGNINFFGGPSSTSAKISKRLIALEEKEQNAMFLFVSDVWLDQLKVMTKLRQMFQGYSEVPPNAIVFFGDYTSINFGSQHSKIVKDLFKQLAELISEFPALIQNTKFIFVPGMRDPGLNAILPRPPMPSFVTESFSRLVPNAEFVTNPCRIQYCTQEWVLFREDIVSKMCRNCFYFPKTGSVTEQFVRTLISQGHLCPLPLQAAPVYWGYDHGLSLYPLPDLVVCADQYDSYNINQRDCSVINPGSFARKSFTFKVYYPAAKNVEDCQIPDDE